jgi:hypothetical protein
MATKVKITATNIKDTRNEEARKKHGNTLSQNTRQKKHKNKNLHTRTQKNPPPQKTKRQNR